jgi:hypothetical protein
VLRHNTAQLREARRAAPLPIEKLVFAARLYATRYEPVFWLDRSAGEFLSRMSRRSLGRDRFIAEDLAARIPGARADRAVAGRSRLRALDAAGYTPSHLSEDGAPAAGWTWHSRGGERSFFFHNLAHEFWHSTDRGYMAGEKALEALFGAMAPALTSALVEGYTDLRARRTLEALRADGLAGKSAAGRAYVEALRAEARVPRGPRYDERVWAAHQRKLRRHSYQPYVDLALALEARPGGAEALEAFASRGDVLPLVGALGEGRLRDLAVALAPPPMERYGPHAARAYRALGFPRYFQHELGAIASGRMTSERLRDLKDRAMALTGRAAWELAAAGPRRRPLERLKTLFVAARLWEGVDPRELSREVEEALVPRWTDLLPSPDPRPVLLYLALPAALGVAASPFFGAPWTAAAAIGGLWLADLYNAAWALLDPARRIELARARAQRARPEDFR